MFSGRKTLPGQKNFMSIEEFRQLCFDGKLVSSSLPAREIDMCFCQAMMVQVDELYEKKHIEMTFVEFLEAFCRICSFIEHVKNDEDFEEELFNDSKSQTPSLKSKIESVMWNLIKLCPKTVQDSFVIPTMQSYYNLMYSLEKD